MQSLALAREAIDAGADVIVAQGGEAGGHGGDRATMTLVPEIADLLAATSPETVLVAAGGIADGRGLAAALMLGAEGVLIGSRLLASAEAAMPRGFHDALVAADGDSTVKTHTLDIARGYDWPEGFSGRALNEGSSAAGMDARRRSPNPGPMRWRGSATGPDLPRAMSAMPACSWARPPA